jgi:hypothetical protein
LQLCAKRFTAPPGKVIKKNTQGALDFVCVCVWEFVVVQPTQIKGGKKKIYILEKSLSFEMETSADPTDPTVAFVPPQPKVSSSSSGFVL